MASAETSLSQHLDSFAVLLENFAAPQTNPSSGRQDDGLEDDITTLTYEHALKAHARYRRPPQPSLNAPSSPGSEQNLPNTQPESPPAVASALPATPTAKPSPKYRKSASITVRLTAAEDKQLRGLAGEAGLTVSAYLRSCALEVESLRAQVKQAVAQMRGIDPETPPGREKWLPRFLRRLRHRA